MTLCILLFLSGIGLLLLGISIASTSFVGGLILATYGGISAFIGILFIIFQIIEWIGKMPQGRINHSP